MVQGGYGTRVGTGRGIPVGNTGSLQLAHRYPGRDHIPAKRARRPCRGRSGGDMVPGVTVGGDGHMYHPAGPVGLTEPSLYISP